MIVTTGGDNTLTTTTFNVTVLPNVGRFTVDDGEPNFSSNGFTAVTNPAPPGYATDYHTANSSDAVAEWTFADLANTPHMIRAAWPSGAGLTTAAAYTIGWGDLGDSYATNPPASSTWIMDDANAVLTDGSGQWQTWTVTGLVGGTAHYLDPNETGEAVWTQTDLPDGEYSLAACWRKRWNNATDATYTVEDGAGNVLGSFTVDQKAKHSTEISDGGSKFDTLGSVVLTGGTLVVKLGGRDTGRVVADGIRLEIIGNRAGKTLATASLDQSTAASDLIDGDGTRWANLGMITPHNGQITVRLNGSTDGPVIADAVLVEPMVVLDPRLSLHLSADSFTESDGASVITGTVMRSSPFDDALVVSLVSDDLTEASVPATVTIAAGERLTSFVIDAVDENELDGSQQVQIAVSATGYTGVARTLTVLDDADDGNQPPVFNDAVLSVVENTAAGSVVGALSASDPEGDALTYAITGNVDPDGDGNAAFVMVGNLLFTADADDLNYEANAQHVLTVEVSDGGKSDFAFVTVNVTDVNEPPSLSDQAFEIYEGAPAGTVVGTFSAVDPENASLSYTMTGNPDPDLDGNLAFRIEGDELVVNDADDMDHAAFDSDGASQIQLSIEVSDGLLSDTANATVTIVSAATLSDGLVSFHTFDGDATDGTANGHDGTVYGAVLASDRAGVDNTGYDFDGLSHYIDIGNAPDLALESFTTAAWFKWDSDHAWNDYRVVLSKGDSSYGYEQNYMIYVADGSRTVNARVGFGAGEDYLFSGVSVGDGLWHHVALTVDSVTGEGALYVDGVRRAEKTLSGVPFVDVAAPVTIGVWSGPASGNYGEWDGKIDEVRIYDRAVSSAEVSLMHLADPARTPVFSDQSHAVFENPLIDAQVAVLAATDADGGDLSYSIVAGTDPDGDGNSAFRIDGDRLLVNDPGDFDYELSSQLTVGVEVTDGLLTDTAQILVDLLDVNEVPVANDDSYSTLAGSALTVSAAGILADDVDPDGDALAAVLVSDVSNGVLSLSGDGAFSYTPNTDYYGSDSFTYQASDGEKLSNVATVSINVQQLADVSIATTQQGSEGDGSATIFTLTRTGNTTDPLDVNLILQGTALPNVDYTAPASLGVNNTLIVSFAAGSDTTTVSLPTLSDSVIDSYDSILAVLRSGDGYSIRPGGDRATAVITAENVAVELDHNFADGRDNAFGVWRNYGAFSVLKPDGSIHAWGRSEDFVQAPTDNGYVQIFSSPSVQAAMKVDGSIATWGYGPDGGTGGPSDAGYVTIFSNAGAMGAMKPDGSIVTWGQSQSGGTDSPGVPTGGDYIEVAATGTAFAALNIDGTIASWGTYSTDNLIDPPSDSGYVRLVAAADSFAAIKADGSISSWGDGNQGGSGAPTATGFVQVEGSGAAIAALHENGTVTSWGEAGEGGDGAPVDGGYVKIYAGNHGFVALKEDGSLTAWGHPVYAMAGAPVDSGYVQISSGSRAFAAIKEDGSLVSWGDPDCVGNGPPAQGEFTQIVSTSRAFAALNVDGTISTWGNVDYGASGGPTDAGYTQLMANENAFAAMKEDGSIFAWGDVVQDGTHGVNGYPTDSGYVAFSNPLTNDVLTPVPNQSPIIVGPSDQSHAEGDSVSLQLSATDPDGDALTWNASGLPSGLSINATTGLISGTLAYDEAGSYNVSVSVTDGELSDSQSFTWTVANTNQLPVISYPAGLFAVNEDESLVFSTANGNAFTVTDPDGSDSVLRVQLFEMANDGSTISLATATGITFVSGSNDSGSMFFDGTVSAINAALDGLVFAPPVNFGGNDGLGIGFLVSDMLPLGNPVWVYGEESTDISVTPVNDPPINILPGDQTTTEAIDLVFSAANGNQIIISDYDSYWPLGSGYGGGWDGPYDSIEGTQFDTQMRVSLSVDAGNLTLATTTGITFVSGSNQSAAMTMEGLLSDLNQAIDGLVYSPPNNFTGDATLTVHTDDLGNTGGGSLTDVDELTITVNVTNDAPTGVVLVNEVASLPQDTDTSSAIKVADVVITDDGVGTNTISLTGTDATSFTVVGTELYLAAGTVLDYETQTSYSVTVSVEDSSVSDSTPVTVDYLLTINDVNESDYGDAPAPYPVTQAEDGAEHLATGPTLGSIRDVEADGTHSASADADGADEDGVSFGAIQVGALDAQVTVNVQNAPSGAKLDGWIDFSGDGNWGGHSEHVLMNVDVTEGDNLFTVDVPSWAAVGTTYARFRLSTDGNPGIGGWAADGEVEDYAVNILPPALGSGIFSEQIVISTNMDAIHHAMPVDFDGDGDMDIVQGSIYTDTVSWFENDGAENFSERIVSTNAEGVRGIDAADIDGDGDLDVLSASWDDNKIAWHENLGGGSFTEHFVVNALNAVTVFAEDVDGDGDYDLLSGSNDGDVNLHLNNGQGTFTNLRIANLTKVRSIHATDIDGDGDLDLLSAGTAYHIHRNDGSLNFTTELVIDAWSNHAMTADMDGDGDQDIVGTSDGELAWFEQNNGNFIEHVFAMHSSDIVFVGDMDGDGDPDVLAEDNTDEFDVYLYTNNPQSDPQAGNPSREFLKSTITSSIYRGASVHGSDVDGDGDLDIVSTSTGDDKLAWYRQNALPTLDAIAGASVDEDGSVQLAITGISAGGTESESLLVSAISSDPSLVPNPAVIYTSGDATGQLLIAPASDQHGTVTITVFVTDAGFDNNLGTSADNATLTQTFTLTVNPLPDAGVPLFDPQSFTVVEHAAAGTVVGTLSATDPDGDPIAFLLPALDLDGDGVAALRIEGDSLIVNDPDDLDYETNPINIFPVDATDGLTTVTATITLTLTEENDPPTAVADENAGTVDEGGVLAGQVNVLANDTDPEGMDLTAILVSGPSNHADFNLASDGSFTYTHDGSETISDSFVYKASDGVNDSNEVTVTINVTPQNDPPTAVADENAGTVDEGGVLAGQVNVLANDSDPEGTALTAILVSGPSNEASFNLASDGSFTYTHDGSETISDSFVYKASDGVNESNEVTVTINVTPQNDLPTIHLPASTSYHVDEDAVFTFGSQSGHVISISDPDAGASVIQVELHTNEPDLSLFTLSTTDGLTFVAGSDASDFMRFEGTLPAVNAALDGLQFQGVPNYWADGVYNGTMGINIVVTDLVAADPIQYVDVWPRIAMYIDPVNDPPINVLPADQTTVEETDLVFSNANENAIILSDSDSYWYTFFGHSGPYQPFDDIVGIDTQMRVTLSVDAGVLTLGSTTGITFISGADQSATMTLEGLLFDLNPAIDGLVYSPPNNFSGNATLTVHTDDLGNTGGGSLTDVDGTHNQCDRHQRTANA